MSDAGVNSVNITSAPLLDEIIGHRSGSTRRQKVEQFAAQLASTRPLSLLGLQAPLFALVDDLEASSTTATSAWVYADGVASGIYSKVAGVWTWALPLPYSFIEAQNAGAGTENAIIATSNLPVADGPLVILPIVATTTGAATVSFNGAAALTIKTAAGGELPAGALVAGMRVLGIRSATEFRLLTDIVSAAIVAQAQAAAALAVAAAGSINPANFYTKTEIDGYRTADQNAAKDASNLNAGTVPDARLPERLQSGSSLSIANQAEAEAGAENTKAMTALRVKQAILAFAPTKSGSASVVSLTGGIATEVLNLPANIRVLNVDMVLHNGNYQSYQCLIQLGDASAYAVSGYQNSQNGSYPNSVTAGIDISIGADAVALPISVRATRLTGNLWSYQVLSPTIYERAGTVTLSGELTRLKYVKTTGVAPINNSQMKVSWEF